MAASLVPYDSGDSESDAGDEDVFDEEDGYKETQPPCKKVPKFVQTTVDKYFGGSGPSHAVVKAKRPRSRYYGVELFTTKDIDDSVGLEKSFKEFWNDKVQEICLSKECRSKLSTKPAVEGAVRTAWTLEKTKFLEIEADEIRTLMKRAYPLSIFHLKVKSIDDNVQRMNTILSDINTQYSLIECGEDVAVVEATIKKKTE